MPSTQLICGLLGIDLTVNLYTVLLFYLLAALSQSLSDKYFIVTKSAFTASEITTLWRDRNVCIIIIIIIIPTYMLSL